MEIIKRGEIKKPKIKFTCKQCETIFIADDTEYKNADQMAYMHDGIIAECVCPVCGRMAYYEGK